MTLEAIYFISQVIAAVALVVSLIFVGVQIRQNTAQAKRNEEATKAAAAEAAHRALVDWQMSMTPERARIAMKANADFESLSNEEVFILGTSVTPLLLDMQEAHTKWLEGSLVESRWRAWDQYAGFSVSPAVLGFWEQRRPMFSDTFQAYYEDKIAEAKSTRPLHSYNYVFREKSSSETSPTEMAKKESPTTGGDA